MIIKYTVKGLVQGIGYRPWVAKLADELNIDGWVRNTGGIVSILASGEENKLTDFKNRLCSEVPTVGFITSIDEEYLETQPVAAGFKIVE